MKQTKVAIDNTNQSIGRKLRNECKKDTMVKTQWKALRI